MQIWESHSCLYHYTTHAGLQGILETQTLYATHYKYLNDTTEMFHMSAKLAEVIKPAVRTFISSLAKEKSEIAEQIKKDGGLENITAHDSNKIAATLFNVTFATNRKIKFFDPYIVSFCSHKDDYELGNGLLSQWRAYGRDSGYAIVFDTRKLSQLLVNEANTYFYDSGNMGDVIYEGDDQGFTSEFNALIEAIKEAVPKLYKPGTQNLGGLYSAFVRSAPRYKHRGFREEQEVRAILSPMSGAAIESFKKADPEQFDKAKHKKHKLVKFRERLTPYIVLFDNPKIQLPITKIIVGPHQEKKLRLQKLVKYLELRGIEIEVSCSKTPLL